MKTARRIVFYILQFWLHVGYRFFFRKVILIDHRKVTNHKPIILAPNHQNSFFDALMTAIFVPQRFTFLARADVFKNPVMRFILYLVSCLPVYRPRDGFATIKNNGETFDQCQQLLIEDESLLIFPEGNQQFGWRLRELKKGLARIALNYTVQKSENLPVVPVGIHFEDYLAFNKGIVVAFGSEITSENYTALYRENPSVALNKMTSDLRSELDTLCISNEDAARRDEINQLIFAGSYPNAASWRKRVAGINNNSYSAEEVRATRFKKNALHWLFTPVAFLGLVIFILPYSLMQTLTRKLSPDEYFAPSIQFTLFLFIFPWYLFLVAVTISLISTGWTGIAFFVVAPFIGKYTLLWHRHTIA
jgi:1-acyl-sn-glycerol-3-phosphate acyltransferase